MSSSRPSDTPCIPDCAWDVGSTSVHASCPASAVVCMLQAMPHAILHCCAGHRQAALVRGQTCPSVMPHHSPAWCSPAASSATCDADHSRATQSLAWHAHILPPTTQPRREQAFDCMLTSVHVRRGNRCSCVHAPCQGRRRCHRAGQSRAGCLQTGQQLQVPVRPGPPAEGAVLLLSWHMRSQWISGDVGDVKLMWFKRASGAGCSAPRFPDNDWDCRWCLLCFAAWC